MEFTSEGFLTLETLIRHALARGYCHPDNAHKELDAKLVDAMVTELLAIPVFVDAVRRGRS